MWTTENRRRYDRDEFRYPSDLADEEWAKVEHVGYPSAEQTPEHPDRATHSPVRTVTPIILPRKGGRFLEMRIAPQTQCA